MCRAHHPFLHALRQFVADCYPLHVGHAPHLAFLESTPWASATYLGARHQFDLILSSQDRSAIGATIHQLQEADFNVAGHIVVDIHLESLDQDEKDPLQHRLRFAALTLNA